MMKNSYIKIQDKINIKFNDLELLKKAFIHKSYINEHRNEALGHNERLEFLGDAVLELVVTKYLFFNYPNQAEGEMTAFRSALVKGKHLAEVAEELSIGEYLFLSHGEERSGGREKKYILANTMESLIGAIYVDQGYDAAEKFISNFILARLDSIIEEGSHIDSKSKFQEIAQEKEEFTPHYELLSEIGPDHDKKFKMGAYIENELIATGEGSSKQKAEQKAAENALKIKGWF